MIAIKNFVTNSLRKDRTEAFEKDLKMVYEACQDRVMAKMKVPEFKAIWEKCKMQYIFQCLSPEEYEDQYAQLLYEVTLKKYFFLQSKDSKIFSIFCLYFQYYACERHRKIGISAPYLRQLKNLIQENGQQESDADYMKIIRHLNEGCFRICTKVGIRTPIIRPNGEPLTKAPMVKLDPLEFMKNLSYQLQEVNKIFEKYNQVAKNSKISEAKLKDLKMNARFRQSLLPQIDCYRRNVEDSDDN